MDVFGWLVAVVVVVAIAIIGVPVDLMKLSQPLHQINREGLVFHGVDDVDRRLASKVFHVDRPAPLHEIFACRDGHLFVSTRYG